jgi:hypothetical protein
MPNKRVSEKEIVVSTPAPARRKPVTGKRVKRAAPAAAQSPAAQPAPAAPSQEQIARLAYSYWEARGCQGGSPQEDWLRAEQELAAHRQLSATATA